MINRLLDSQNSSFVVSFSTHVNIFLIQTWHNFFDSWSSNYCMEYGSRGRLWSKPSLNHAWAIINTDSLCFLHHL